MEKLKALPQDIDMPETISPEDLIKDSYDADSSKVNLSAFNNWSNWGNGPLDPGGYTSKKE